jgi:hypothetical protein
MMFTGLKYMSPLGLGWFCYGFCLFYVLLLTGIISSGSADKITVFRGLNDSMRDFFSFEGSSVCDKLDTSAVWSWCQTLKAYEDHKLPSCSCSCDHKYNTFLLSNRTCLNNTQLNSHKYFGMG